MGVHPIDEEGRAIPDAGWPPGREAPGRLERVRRFLNTVNRESGADHFHEPIRATRWLANDGWDVRTGEDDLAALRRFRAALRDLIDELSLGTDQATATWPAEAAIVRLAFAPAPGGPQLVGSGSGTDRVIGDLVAIIVEARADGSLSRLRRCANEHCGWAYYDRSKSGSGRWCSMGACGQRQKMRRYRARHRPGDR